MKLRLLILQVLFCAVTLKAGPLSGIYYIGPDTPSVDHYFSFSKAVQALKDSGIAAPVVFRVRDGDYFEHVVFDQPISGTSLVNTITFESASGDNTAVRLYYNGPTGSDPEVVKFYNVSSTIRDIIFKNMTFEILPGFGTQYIVLLQYRASNIHFIDNIFKAHNAGAVTHLLALGIAPFPDSIYVSDNKFYGGNTVFTHGMNCNKLEVQNNLCYKQRLFGIAFSAKNVLNSVWISGNQFIADTVASYEAISITSSRSNAKILNNMIHLRQGSQKGIDIQGSVAASLGSSLVLNNYIAMHNKNSGTFQGRGISISGNSSDYALVYHNTISFYGEQDSSSIAMSFGNQHSEFKNNIVFNTIGGMALKTTKATLQSDYNNLYSNGKLLGDWVTQIVDNMNDWIFVSSRDSHSIAVDPCFINDSSYQWTNYQLNDLGIALGSAPYTEVLSDINDLLRSETADPGLIELNMGAINSNIFNSVSDTICEGDSLTLASAVYDDADYNWSTGSTDPAIVVNTPGTYWLSISRCNELITDTIVIVQKNCDLTYVNSYMPDEALFQVFPNPSFGTLRISKMSTEESLELRVLDIKGELLYNRRLAESELTLDIAQSGLYLLEVRGSATYQIRRIVIF